MKILLVALFLFISCSDNEQKLLPASSGNINNISVVTNDELWEGAVGEVIRENFGRPIYGLPQIEPIFSLSHIPSKAPFFKIKWLNSIYSIEVDMSGLYSSVSTISPP